MAAGYIELNAWTANFLNIVVRDINTALVYWGKRFSTTEKQTINSKDSRAKTPTKVITVPFTFDQAYATKLLNDAANALGAARVNLVGILNTAGISPGISGPLLASFDQAAKPLFDFQKNTTGAVPNLEKPLYNWYLNSLRPLLLKLQSK